MIRHYTVVIKARRRKLLADDVSKVASKCLKLDDTPIIKKLKSKRMLISLSVDYNSLPNSSEEICNNIVNPVMNII